MPNIGVVSTINFADTSHQAAFNAGVSAAAAAAGTAAPVLTIKDKLGFDNRKKISETIDALSSDATVTCVATVGGLICCHEAILNATNKSFVSLIGYLPAALLPSAVIIPAAGAVPATISPFKGCVTLDTIASITTRVNWITNAAHWGTAPANIGLLYDKNTAMATHEITAFQAALAIALAAGQVVDAANGRLNPENYLLDFQQFSANIKSIIISAAPFFWQTQRTTHFRS